MTGTPLPFGENEAMTDFGCEYCADDTNRWYGDVTQIASSEARHTLLLRCPRCDTLYENSPAGPDQTRRLTEEEARQLFPEMEL